jgi:hypothetical protein
MLRRLLLAAAMVFLFCVSAAFGAQQKAKTVTRSSRAAALHYLESRLQRFEEETWYWERLTGSPRTDTAGRRLQGMAVTDLEHTVRAWQLQDSKAHRAAQRPPHMNQWMCIHRYEGAWNDVGGPYWGGLQMSLTFQQRYGGWIYRLKGTADHWTPLEQIWTAEKALRSRGFWPWPNTARLCGLI